MEAKQCSTCLYWLDYPMHYKGNEEIATITGNLLYQYFDGICRRYPKYEPRNIGDWCGEFKQSE